MPVFANLIQGNRPGQPSWEYTMWKFQDFSATQILREINFGHFEAPKNASLTILVALNFRFFEIHKVSKIANFDLLKAAKLISRKIQENC